MIGSALAALSSRAGLVAIALVVGYLAGHKAAVNGQTVRQLRAQTAALQSDLATFRAAARAAEREADQFRGLQNRLQEKLDEYETALAARGEDNACRLDGADIERLRNLK